MEISRLENIYVNIKIVWQQHLNQIQVKDSSMFQKGTKGTANEVFSVALISFIIKTLKIFAEGITQLIKLKIVALAFDYIR